MDIQEAKNGMISQNVAILVSVLAFKMRCFPTMWFSLDGNSSQFGLSVDIADFLDVGTKTKED